MRGTKWPFMCWCAVKNLHTHWLLFINLTFYIVYHIQRLRFVSCLINQWLIDWLIDWPIDWLKLVKKVNVKSTTRHSLSESSHAANLLEFWSWVHISHRGVLGQSLTHTTLYNMQGLRSHHIRVQPQLTLRNTVTLVVNW